MVMEIHTSRFGAQQGDPEKVIFFENGLAGFEMNKAYHFFHQDVANPVLFYLQSLDNHEFTIQLTNHVFCLQHH